MTALRAAVQAVADRISADARRKVRQPTSYRSSFPLLPLGAVVEVSQNPYRDPSLPEIRYDRPGSSNAFFTPTPKETT